MSSSLVPRLVLFLIVGLHALLLVQGAANHEKNRCVMHDSCAKPGSFDQAPCPYNGPAIEVSPSYFLSHAYTFCAQTDTFTFLQARELKISRGARRSLRT